jgi:hypothetical protein
MFKRFLLYHWMGQHHAERPFRPQTLRVPQDSVILLRVATAPGGARGNQHGAYVDQVMLILARPHVTLKILLDQGTGASQKSNVHRRDCTVISGCSIFSCQFSHDSHGCWLQR